MLGKHELDEKLAEREKLTPRSRKVCAIARPGHAKRERQAKTDRCVGRGAGRGDLMGATAALRTSTSKRGLG